MLIGCVEGICDESHNFTTVEIFGGVAALSKTTETTNPSQHNASTPYPKVKLNEIYQAPVVGVKKIVIGENMDRVKEFAASMAAHFYHGMQPYNGNPKDGLKHNRQWIKQQMDEKKEIIDIGADFLQRASGTRGAPSANYNMERKELQKYDKYTKAFERIGGIGGNIDINHTSDKNYQDIILNKTRSFY